jgi:hypothetical protein
MKNKLVIIMALLICNAFPQSFITYPLNLGDYWQYKISYLNEYYSWEVIGDTTMLSNGLTYKIKQSNSGYKSHSRFFEDKVYSYSTINQEETIEYDFTLLPGDTLFFIPDTFVVTLIDIRYENIFGLDRKQWLFLFDAIPFIDDEVIVTITDSIGLTSTWNIFETHELVGAIINGRTYGTIVSIGDPKNELKKSFILSQNYPNPFNPTTVIKYQLPEAGLVTLKVFDILGNEIETLVNEQKQTGTYEITWYAEGLPSGIYFYRLQAGDFIETKKMILMK